MRVNLKSSFFFLGSNERNQLKEFLYKKKHSLFTCIIPIIITMWLSCYLFIIDVSAMEIFLFLRKVQGNVWKTTKLFMGRSNFLAFHKRSIMMLLNECEERNWPQNFVHRWLKVKKNTLTNVEAYNLRAIQKKMPCQIRKQRWFEMSWITPQVD